MSFEYDSLLDDEDLASMDRALHDNRLMGVEEMFDRPVSPPPLPLLVPAPPAPVPPAPAPKRFWTTRQDLWLLDKYSNKPKTGTSEDTRIYWASCATEFQSTYGQKRTVAALVKRASLRKLSNGRKRVGASSKPVGAGSKPVGVASKPVGAGSKRVHHQWDLKVETWIAQKVPANAHLSDSYLQSVISDFNKYNQNTSTHTISAWRNKINRMLPHRKLSHLK